MKQPEYAEGPEALENFKRLATAILQAPPKKQKKPTKKSASVTPNRVGRFNRHRVIRERSKRDPSSRSRREAQQHEISALSVFYSRPNIQEAHVAFTARSSSICLAFTQGA